MVYILLNHFDKMNSLAECKDTFSLRGKEYGCEGSLVSHTHNQLFSREDCENHCLKENKDNCTGYFYLAYQTSEGTDCYCYNYQTAPMTTLLTKQGGYYERNLCYQSKCDMCLVPEMEFVSISRNKLIVQKQLNVFSQHLCHKPVSERWEL